MCSFLVFKIQHLFTTDWTPKQLKGMSDRQCSHLKHSYSYVSLANWTQRTSNLAERSASGQSWKGVVWYTYNAVPTLSSAFLDAEMAIRRDNFSIYPYKLHDVGIFEEHFRVY